MKKLLFTTFVIVAVSASSIAQTSDAPEVPASPAVPAAPAKAEMTKEEKAAMKAKQDAEYMAAYKGAGLTDDEIAQVKIIMADASKLSSEVKKNDKLSDTEKEAAKKKISDEKNEKLKALMGKDRYKVYSDIRTKQKKAAAPKAE